MKKLPSFTSIDSYSPTTFNGGKVTGISAGVASNHQDYGKPQMAVIDEENENRTCEVSVRHKLEFPEQRAPPNINGDLSAYVFEGEGLEEGEITEMVKRSQTQGDSIEKDITFVSTNGKTNQLQIEQERSS